jgi:hypothetical protein
MSVSPLGPKPWICLCSHIVIAMPAARITKVGEVGSMPLIYKEQRI